MKRVTHKSKTELVQLGEQVQLPPEPFRSEQSREDTRRDFLTRMGFSTAAAALAGCRAPVQNAVPLVTGSDRLIPGVASYYATTCGACSSACSLLVKQRDGRPIKIEGNEQSALFGGGTCATGQAAVLSLYDGERLRGPLWQKWPIAWQDLDRRVAGLLADARQPGNRIVLLSGTLSSPSTSEIIADWARQFPGFRHVVYDAVSLSALRAANRESFGRAIIPHYAFDKARVIVGLEADFLGTWLSPVEFSAQYARSRSLDREPSLHVQFESGLSVTGSNADLRIPVAPSEIGIIAVSLLRRIAEKAGLEGAPRIAERNAEELEAVANRLWLHRGESLIVSGVQDQSVQIVVNALNQFLGNIAKTVDLSRPSLQRAGDDSAMAELVEELNRGEVHTVMLHGVNPVYDYPEAGRFLAGLQKAALSISFSDRIDETSAHVTAVCPDNHFLEAWGDAEPVDSHFSLAQPLIAPLFNTRAMQTSLLTWLGKDSDYYSYVREFWRKNIFPRQREAKDFETFWDSSLQSGVRVIPSEPPKSVSFQGDWRAAARDLVESHERSRRSRPENICELHFYESVALRDGRHANNPWLQELPDPITKVTWGNFAAVAPKLAKRLQFADGDVISLKTESASVDLPILVQPGQHEETISVAMGYGRNRVGKVGQGVGVNTFPYTSVAGGFQRYSASNVTLEKTGKRDRPVSTQTHFSMEGRPIALETSIRALREHSQAGVESDSGLPTLWAERLQGEHSWGMVIDLNACTGCSACVIACQAENNVPVVGKDQVERIRIMHWMRIDAYYSDAEDNPSTVHQPMMCQHCGHAPCETVCPVLATTTSSEGINQQVYNRCIGTRYCANNCPYKVRRFNWYNYTDNPRFDFNMATPLGRMVLNPDVVVRSRGVMEKCSLCVQRVQLAKNTALKEKRRLVDGDIQTACQQACPTSAIVFGDLKDPNSRVSRLERNPRYYRVLEELGTRPNVGYLKKVRNTEI
jgi:molybdopterin-containing oxidoreductase family iron-sulfur binding subunit